MLARVADNLFWFGRYVERSEHLSRYLNIQYFSTLDAPFETQRELSLQSVMNMVGIPIEEENIFEEQILVAVAMDENNPSSIRSSVFKARENARGARDLLSIELWNTVNKFYRFIHDYPEEYYKTRGLDDFTRRTIDNCAIIKSNIQNTLLHDQVWAIIKMGMHLERSIQVNRMILSKLNDVARLQEMKVIKTVESFQWATLLQSAEGYDMFRRIYSASPMKRQTLEFIVLNKMFPRSISYNITALQSYLRSINPSKNFQQNSIDWRVGRLSEELKYRVIDEFIEAPVEFLEKTLDQIYNLNNLLSKEYLNY